MPAWAQIIQGVAASAVVAAVIWALVNLLLWRRVDRSAADDHTHFD